MTERWEICHGKFYHGLELAQEKVYITTDGRTGEGWWLAKAAEVSMMSPQTWDVGYITARTGVSPVGSQACPVLPFPCHLPHLPFWSRNNGSVPLHIRTMYLVLWITQELKVKRSCWVSEETWHFQTFWGLLRHWKSLEMDWVHFALWNKHETSGVMEETAQLKLRCLEV